MNGFLLLVIVAPLLWTDVLTGDVSCVNALLKISCIELIFVVFPLNPLSVCEVPYLY